MLAMMHTEAQKAAMRCRESAKNVQWRLLEVVSIFRFFLFYSIFKGGFLETGSFAASLNEEID